MKRQNLLLTGVLCACVALGSQFLAADAFAAKKITEPKNVSQALKLKYPKHKTKVASPKVGKKAVQAYELYSADKNKEAIKLLRGINTKSDFDRAYVDRFLGNLLAGEEGKADESIKLIEKAVKLNVLNPSDQAQSMRLLGDLYMQEKQYKEAIETYKAWMAYTDWQDKTIYVRMGQASYELKQYAQVIPYADKAIALATKPDKNAYLLKLSSYYERKLYKDSVSVLEEIVRLFPGEAKWWAQLGMFYMLIEDYDKALSTMEVAYRNDLLSKANHFKGLAQLYYNGNVPYKGAVVLEKYLDNGTIKRDKRMVTQLANSYRMAKHFDKAAKYYGEAGKMENDGEAYRKQASMYLLQEKYPQAIKAAQAALNAGVKREGSVNMMIAEAYLYQKNLKNAYKFARKAIKDPSTKKMAASWSSYIKSKAQTLGVKL